MLIHLWKKIALLKIMYIPSGQKEKLNWRIRYNIAFGTASGLSYLHEGCQRRIIHRDIKAANILLSGDFEPRPNVYQEGHMFQCLHQSQNNRNPLNLKGRGT